MTAKCGARGTCGDCGRQMYIVATGRCACCYRKHRDAMPLAPSRYAPVNGVEYGRLTEVHGIEVVATGDDRDDDARERARRVEIYRAQAAIDYGDPRLRA